MTQAYSSAALSRDPRTGAGKLKTVPGPPSETVALPPGKAGPEGTLPRRCVHADARRGARKPPVTEGQQLLASRQSRPLIRLILALPTCRQRELKGHGLCHRCWCLHGLHLVYITINCEVHQQYQPFRSIEDRSISCACISAGDGRRDITGMLPLCEHG